MYKQLERYRKANERVRIAKYGRCSTDEQGKNGYTIKDQLEYIEMFAKENDLLVVDEYIDEGISATLEIVKRKALAQMIKDAKAGKFDIVVIKCLDRFFRNVGEYYAAQKQLQKAGVTWLSIEEPDLDPDDADAAFKINIYLSMSEYEARKASKRVRFTNQMRIKNKQVVTGSHNFPFPWVVSGEKKNKCLVRDPAQLDRLNDLLDHFETFQSKSATVVYNNSKYENISYGSLGKLLTHTLLYGEYKGVKEYVEPTITKERFDKIQEILSRNARHNRHTDRVYTFSGIVKCRCCGVKLAGSFYQPKGRNFSTTSYRCNNHIKNKICANSHSISEKIIEAQLLDNLGQYIENEIVRVQAIREKETPEIDNTKKIEAVKKEIARLNNMYRKGRIEEEEYDKEYDALHRKIKALKPAEKPKERDLTALKQLSESDYRTMYEALDKEHRKAFWRKIIKEFSMTEDRKVDPESIIFF